MISIYRISAKPRYLSNGINLSFFAPFAVAHIPVAAFGITSDHLESAAKIIQQAVRNAGRYNDDIAPLNYRLDPAFIIFAPKTKLSAPMANAQNFVCCTVKVTRAVHGVSPLRLDDTKGGKARFDG
ncbi:hypothetical protein CLIM01_04808 [Colletotrichum limetticola]|uniref:Uncharacterized protein n=1 Tax=Colletotrichum limetticola TaxID=1209924 RepID=A0ABQ9Q223_9PEZI|nr:hypothetical protein CLIM01_04808 [Colletotrichum limetticola]